MRSSRVGGYWPGANGTGWSGSAGGIVGVRRGDMDGDVGVGAGLNERKKTALVRAPETFCKCIDEGVNPDECHLGTR